MKTCTFFQRYKEIIYGLCLLAMGAFYFHHATKIVVRGSIAVNARAVPEMLGLLLIGLAALQIAVGVKHLLTVKRQAAEDGAEVVFMSAEERLGVLPMAMTFLLIFGYALFFERLGFIVASVLFMFLLMLVLTPKGKARPGLYAVVAVLSALVSYTAFRWGLNLILPQGVLEFLRF